MCQPKWEERARVLPTFLVYWIFSFRCSLSINSTEIVVLDLNPSMTFTTNWQSYVFNNMPIGVNNGGSQALFNQYVSQVDQLQVQVVPQGSPNVATLFGYDSNNTVDIDNIKWWSLSRDCRP